MSQKEEKLTQILDAAAEEFLTKGFEAASMHNIALEAEVSKRTLYKYYPTKDDLYGALIDEILNRFDGLYTLDYSDEISIKEQIQKIVETKMELLLTDSFIKISKIVMSELIKGKMPTDEQAKRLNQLESAFLNWIDRAQVDKKITREYEAKDIATQFHAILKGQIYWPVLTGMCDPKSINQEKVKKSTVDFFINTFCTK